MATIKIRTAPSGGTKQKARLLSETGEVFVFTWAPVEIDHDGLTPSFGVIDRPGRKPLSRPAGGSLRSLSFTSGVGNVDAEISCEASLAALRAIGESGARVQFIYGGPLTIGWWTITGLQILPTARVQGTNHVSRADVTVTLTEASDLRPTVGKTVTKAQKAKGWRSHKVKNGDTLFTLATKYLGKGTRWKQIASANKIKNPKKSTKLKVGSLLRIPPAK